MNTIPSRLKYKLREVYQFEPNHFDNELVNAVYKRISSICKSMPAVIVIPISVILSIAFYVLTGAMIIRLASILQYGF